MEIEKKHLKEELAIIINGTFEKLKYIYSFHKEKLDKGIISGKTSRLIFPCFGEHRENGENKVRVSEQELRFAFVESFY